MNAIDIPMKSELYSKNLTLYYDSSVQVKGCVIYFHGGGLLYGSRKDLPSLHIERLTGAGYMILSCDYPLAPACKLDAITDDIISTIQSHRAVISPYSEKELPYFLWGRSSGAYLALIAGANEILTDKPTGIISYYGYGFLCDNWYGTSSRFYSKMPKVPQSCLENIPSYPHAQGELDTHYSVYVYARQSGKWKDLIYEGRDKFFYMNYSLRLRDKMPCPLFCAHSTGDTDVPFSEFTELCSRYNPKRFVAASDEHDFDRHTDNPFTSKLIDATVSFLDQYSEVSRMEKRYS